MKQLEKETVATGHNGSIASELIKSNDLLIVVLRFNTIRYQVNLEIIAEKVDSSLIHANMCLFQDSYFSITKTRVTSIPKMTTDLICFILAKYSDT